MAYAGWDMSFRTFQQKLYIAVGGETTIPNKGVPESVLYKDGKLLTPYVDYNVNYTTGVITLTTAATAGAQYQVLNLSTFHVADTYTKSQIDNIALICNFYTATYATPLTLTYEAVLVEIDCSSGPTYATLPTSPKKGVIIRFRDKSATITQDNKFTLKRSISNSTIMGLTEDMEVTTPRCSFSAVWNGSDWRIF